MRIGILGLALAFTQTASGPYFPDVTYNLPGAVITAAELQKVKTAMVANQTRDVPIRMINGGGDESGHQVGVSLVYRLKGMTTDAVIHDKVSEVFHILEGAGTVRIGGTLLNPQRRTLRDGNGPGIGGTGIEGGTTTRVAKGDVVIIPAGSPHRFEMLEEFTLYTVTRIDPSNVTPLK